MVRKICWSSLNHFLYQLSLLEWQSSNFLFFPLSLPCIYIHVLMFNCSLSAPFSVLVSIYSSSPVLALISMLNHLLPNLLTYLSFPCWPSAACLQIHLFPKNVQQSWSSQDTFASPVMLLCPVCLFQHKIMQPLSITSFTLKWDKVWVFSSKQILLLR